MKTNSVTMVHPRQIVSKGLKGCSSTRTVMNFAQKYNVPCVWWSPTRTQKVLLVDWPVFRTTWKQVCNTKTTTPSTFKNTTSSTGRTFPTYAKTTTTKTTPGKTGTFYGKNTTRTTNRTTTGRTYTKRTRRAA